jgi:hypothetical protein
MKQGAGKDVILRSGVIPIKFKKLTDVCCIFLLIHLLHIFEGALVLIFVHPRVNDLKKASLLPGRLRLLR